jgi:16S rRNA C1402 (ribose-2'-O) methylase RsmI
MLVFLDIDGVMVPAKSWQNPPLLEDGFPGFSIKAVTVLQNLLSEDVTVVLTTSHRLRYTLEQWKKIFQHRGLYVCNLTTIGKSNSYQSRRDELLHWFNTHTVTEDFIIIDDDKSLHDLPPFLKERLVLTSPMIGLNEGHTEAVNAILRSKSQLV